MSTNFAYLPPLPPIAVPLPGARAAWLRSQRRENLLAAVTVLLAGITALAWAIRLDTTDSEIFTTAAATLAVILPQATFSVLRATSRRR